MPSKRIGLALLALSVFLVVASLITVAERHTDLTLSWCLILAVKTQNPRGKAVIEWIASAVSR